TDALPADMELWWVGPDGWLAGGALGGTDARGRTIRFLGMVPDRWLCALYRQATFTIYPSLYEGFGFPVLDSLLHETPVVCSFNSSLQEFAGCGVMFFDPTDRASLDAACGELAARPPELDVPALRARFSWDALARAVLGLCA